MTLKVWRKKWIYFQETVSYLQVWLLTQDHLLAHLDKLCKGNGKINSKQLIFLTLKEST
jgi:hypothetical protein